jgi:hypothetical protein
MAGGGLAAMTHDSKEEGQKLTFAFKYLQSIGNDTLLPLTHKPINKHTYYLDKN